MGTLCPPDHNHGETLTCTTSHGCTCSDCRTAHREYSYWRRHMIEAGRADVLNSRVDPTGARRRIQALMCLGWSQVQIATHAGTTQTVISAHLYNRWITRNGHDRIATVYELLSARIPATDTTSQRMSVHRTRALARRNGWAPPLAWDDIDDPDEQPTGHLVCTTAGCARAAQPDGRCSGHQRRPHAPPPISPQDRADLVARIHELAEAGLTDPEIGRRVGKSADAVFKIRHRNALGEKAS